MQQPTSKLFTEVSEQEWKFTTRTQVAMLKVITLILKGRTNVEMHNGTSWGFGTNMEISISNSSCYGLSSKPFLKSRTHAVIRPMMRQ